MLSHNYSSKEIANLAKWRGKIEGKRVELTCEYKKGATGVVFFETVDEENNRPYLYVKLDEKPSAGFSKYQVFWYNEIELIDEL